jgi:hypothetical protein
LALKVPNNCVWFESFQEMDPWAKSAIFHFSLFLFLAILILDEIILENGFNTSMV